MRLTVRARLWPFSTTVTVQKTVWSNNVKYIYYSHSLNCTVAAKVILLQFSRWRQCSRRAVSSTSVCCSLFVLFCVVLVSTRFSHMIVKLFWILGLCITKHLIWSGIQKIYPRYLRRLPFSPPHKKRSRRRGKRGVLRVRIKAFRNPHNVATCSAFMDTLPPSRAHWDHSSHRLFCHRWIRPVGPHAPVDLPAEPPPFRSWVRSSRAGVNHSNLRHLRYVPASKNVTPPPPDGPAKHKITGK